MSSLTAKKLNNTEIKNSQLAKFVASLGVTSNLELYLCGSYVYINVDIILPVLLVDLAWFRKNAEIPTHYILIKKKVYINKYGMTKLLGQSKQPAAFMLQDYLYEIFYKVETDGSVSRDDLMSRKNLVSLTEELTTYKAIVEQTQNSLANTLEESKIISNDNATLEMENTQLIAQVEQLEYDNETITKDLETYKTIANDLAKYVRFKVKNPPDIAYGDDLDDDDTDLELVEKKAAESSDALKKANKVRKKNSILKPINYSNYYFMRSIQPVEHDNYLWNITDVEPSEEVMKLSEEFMSGNMIYVTCTDICYRKIAVTEDKKNTILLFLEIMGNVTDEQVIERLIS